VPFTSPKSNRRAYPSSVHQPIGVSAQVKINPRPCRASRTALPPWVSVPPHSRGDAPAMTGSRAERVRVKVGISGSG
jgi:hypothetical protein